MLATVAPLAAHAIAIDDPLGGITPIKLFASVIRALFGVVGILALVFFIIGGITWLTSGGNPEKIEKGSKTLMWATLGLIAIFMSFLLISFLFNVLGGAIAPIQ
ncbi:MAG: hypothetical protein Q7S89_01240 [bacterium]|nr:hypothetical protein [bacterium]